MAEAVLSKIEAKRQAKSGPYRPLDSRKREIRLLDLLYFSKDECYLEGSLSVVSLDDDIDYIALSYEWSPPELGNNRTMLSKIDGHQMYLTANLYLALLFLTRGVSTTKFWVDALCIDQEDNEERAQQVAMMTQIYEKAPSVIAWLGTEADNSNLAMDFLSKFWRFYEFQYKHQPTDSPYRNVRKWLRSKFEDFSYTRHWKAVSHLCERSYWSRRWIVQELVVAAALRTHLVCGFRKIPILSLFVPALCAQLFPYKALATSTNASKFRDSAERVAWIAHGWEKYQDVHSRMDLLRCLENFCSFETSEPRDRVYALRGIAKPLDEPKLIVDYSASVSEVFTHTAKSMILNSQNLNVLLHCSTHRESSLDLPSWVPDWACYDREALPVLAPHNRTSARGFRYPEVHFSSDGRILKAKVILIGKIVDLVSGESTRIVPGEEHQYEAHASALLRNWISFAIKDLRMSFRDETASDGSLERGLNVMFFIYEANFLNIVDGHLNMAALPFDKWLNWVLSSWSDVSKLPFLTWEQLPFLALRLTAEKRLFKHQLLTNQRSDQIVQGLGLCGKDAIAGDIVAVILGCQQPVIIRENVGKTDYRLIGGANVDGMMNGEAIGVLPQVEISIT